MRSWTSKALVCVAVVALTGACSDDENTLSGSLGQVYDLSFSNTRARLYSSEFAVEYVREDRQVPVRVVVERNEKPEISTGTINLEERGTIIGRIDARRLPTFESGSLNLTTFAPEQGARVQGSFNSTLVSGGSTYSLEGNFRTTLDVVDGSLGYEVDDAGSSSEADSAEADSYEPDGGS